MESGVGIADGSVFVGERARELDRGVRQHVRECSGKLRICGPSHLEMVAKFPDESSDYVELPFGYDSDL